MTTSGTPSNAAFATPVAALVSPGPKCVSRTPGLAGRTGISIRHVRGNLFVAGCDKSDVAFAQCVEECNIGMTAKSKDHLDADLFEIVRQLIRKDAIFAHWSPRINESSSKCLFVGPL